ncbi:MAG: rubrerythrin [Candidatus Odinarchaeota archaeon]
MMKLKGTKTEKNLLTSFAGESQARNRYQRYAKAAMKDGYEYVAQVFEETAKQEYEHASRFFKFMDEGECTPEIKVEWDFPTGHIGTTEENLRSAAAGEKFEFSSMYPGYADVAEKEGFSKIALVWRMIAKAEMWHHERYHELAERIANGSILKKKEKIKWRCENCGYIHEGESPPEKCPACDHPKGYFFPHVFK